MPLRSSLVEAHVHLAAHVVHDAEEILQGLPFSFISHTLSMRPLLFNNTYGLPALEWPSKQIAMCPPFQDGDHGLFSMLGSVMVKMAALAKGLQVSQPVVAGQRIASFGNPMRGRQDHLDLLEQSPIVTIIQPVDHPPLPVPPSLLHGIEPAPVPRWEII